MSVSASISGASYLLTIVGIGAIFQFGKVTGAPSQIPVGWNDTEGPAPQFRVTLVITVTGSSAGIQPSFQLKSDTFTAGTGDPLTEPDSLLDGNNVVMEGRSLVNTGGSIVSHILSPMTIVPSEFWPFKNRLGQDVYDTTSGDQINDPFG